jgi:copper transport protein
MSVWSAGLVLLLFALPGATRELAPGDRARLLAANLVRFSTAAGIAVAALIVTGALQAWFEVAGWGRLLDTAFGRAVLIKSLLLLGPLVALAAHNRLVLLPRLRRIAADGEPPGAAGALLRRALILEVVLICAALGVTSALVSYPPPESLAVAGPVAETVSLGPADLQVTVDPARAGPNAMHFYLTDKRDGTQYDDAKEFSVSASLPGRDLGPVPIDTRKAGPGHWVANGATFSPAGEWRLQARARVSEFDAYYAEVAVPIE